MRSSDSTSLSCRVRWLFVSSSRRLLDHRQHFAFAENQVFLAFQCDLCASIAAEENTVSSLQLRLYESSIRKKKTFPTATTTPSFGFS